VVTDKTSTGIMKLLYVNDYIKAMELISKDHRLYHT